MENKLTKKYGLFTAICMVVGIVIGSGIFFKAQDVLKETAGNALMGVLAWLIGGAIMAFLAVSFGIMATKYERAGGVVDYAEAMCGKGYAYFFSWFASVIYYPAMTSVLAWVSARYTIVAINGIANSEINPLYSTECMVLAILYMIAIYFMNSIAPKLAGKFQVTTTVIKFIPIVVIALVGTVYGLITGVLVENFKYVSEMAGEIFIDTGSADTNITVGTGNLFAAVCCTVFAYEGWVIATSINAEIKNSKRNLPIALALGALIIVGAYALYYLGILGLEKIGVLGAEGTTAAFGIFGTVGAAVINFMIVVSCLGTLNGLMLGCSRGFYAMAVRNDGIAPDVLVEVDERTNVPHNSASIALLICVGWLAYFITAQDFGPGSLNLFGEYGFDSSELPVVTVYPLYVPILAMFMVKSKDMHPIKRFVIPSLAIIGASVVVAASIIRHGMDNVWYLIVFAVISGIGALFYRGGTGVSVSDKIKAKLFGAKAAADENEGGKAE